jgi:hypothetical protein
MVFFVFFSHIFNGRQLQLEEMDSLSTVQSYSEDSIVSGSVTVNHKLKAMNGS